MKEWVKFRKWLTNYELDIIPKSMTEDLGKTRKTIKFREEWSRAIHELGNIELHELGDIPRTVKYLS